MIIREAIGDNNLKYLISKQCFSSRELEITLIKADFRSKFTFFSDGFSSNRR